MINKKCIRGCGFALIKKVMQKINHSFVERWAMGIILYPLLVLILFAIVPEACLANNIAVNNVKIVDQDPVNDTYDI